MKLRGSILIASFATITLCTTVSCEEDLSTLGDGVIAGEPFNASFEDYDVFAYNKNVEAVQTNRLPLYLLGNYNDPIYGNTQGTITAQVSLPGLSGNPTFGDLSQATEDVADTDDEESTIKEFETVTSVFLHIPYQQQSTFYNDADGDGLQDQDDADPDDADSDSDDDGYSDALEVANGSDPLDSNSNYEQDDFVANNYVRTFALDSIYGSVAVGDQFNLTVTESTYFLGDLDPSTDFLEASEYYSNQNFISENSGVELFSGPVTLSNQEYVFYEEDDEDTEDEDESEVISERLAPGIRVALNNEFFQQKVIDQEGSTILLNQSNFSEFFRGLHLSLDNSDMAMLLDISQATITITYEFTDRVTTDEEDENGDSIVEEQQTERTYTLNLLQTSTNAVNILTNATYGTEVLNALDNNTNAQKIYLKGGAGTFAQVKLFGEEDDTANTVIEQIRANNWVINEANLEFYVDTDNVNNYNSPFRIDPPRLYLYNAETNEALYYSFFENSTADTPLLSFLEYDGNLDDEDADAVKYTFRITQYLNDIIERDSTNAMLNLAITSDIRNTAVQEVLHAGDDELELPIMHTINPFGTILWGSNVDQENVDKKLKLRLYYTESN